MIERALERFPFASHWLLGLFCGGLGVPVNCRAIYGLLTSEPHGEGHGFDAVTLTAPSPVPSR
jgi:hypothetical protein